MGKMRDGHKVERRRMLIWGQTYPELSKTKTETVCTGAVFVDEPGLIRLYPLDIRYMEKEKRIRKWSIIEADIWSSDKDLRPESRKIDPDSVTVIDQLPASEWKRRKELLIRPEHMVSGVDEMRERQRSTGQSLGILKPSSIDSICFDRMTDEDKEIFDQKYKHIINQQEFWGPNSKPMPFLRYRPRLGFTCEADQNTYRPRRVLEWEFIQGAAHHFGQENPAQSFSDWVFPNRFSDNYENYIILGNINGFPRSFVVVSVVYIHKKHLAQKKKPKPKPNKNDPKQGMLFG